MRWNDFAGDAAAAAAACLEAASFVRGAPGVLSAAAYEAVRGGPRYLLLAELSSPAIAATPGFLGATGAIERAFAQQTKIAETRLLQVLYQRIHPLWSDPSEQSEPASFVMIGRMDIPASVEEEFNDWYNTAYIPGFLGVKGCLRARRFVATGGCPKYMTLYEFAHDGVAGSEAWHAARTSNPWSARMAPMMRHDELSPAYCRRIG